MDKDYLKITYNGDATNTFSYVRLGAFLKWMETDLMYQIKNSETGLESSPLLKFDSDIKSNLMYIDPLQVSVDPGICVVYRVLKIAGENVYAGTPPFKTVGDIPNHLESEFGIEYGQIMNIYLNMKYVLLKMEELKDGETHKLPLIDFLNGILSAVNGALGGINSLEAFVDETNNTIKIIDKNPLPNVESKIIPKLKELKYQISSDYALFDLYGYTTSKDNVTTAGFIKDFSFKTELTPAFSTQITVGAAANSNVVGENASALSRLNNGLEDRFKKYLAAPSLNDLPQLPTAEDLRKEFDEIGKNFLQAYDAYLTYIVNLSFPNFKYNSDESETYKESLVNFITFRQQLSEKRKQIDRISNPYAFSPSTGFIPFNLSLTMDGLSGMKINSRFNIDAKYLPSNYPDTVKFLIKNLEHKIEGNKWFTTLESYCISQDADADANKSQIIQELKPQGQKVSSSANTNTNIKTINANYPNVNFKDGVVAGSNPSTDNINVNLLKDISTAAVDTGITVSVTTSVSGHHLTPPSRHSGGNAVDIAIIDGIPVNPRASNRAKIDEFVTALQKLGYKKNAENGNPKALLIFGFPGHDNHVHISNKV